MTNGNHPAMPNVAFDSNGNFTHVENEHYGLTKREFFAAQMLAAYTANHYMGAKKAEEKAKWAVEDADALIKELNKSA